MIAFPAGTKVWIAGGVTDMHCGMYSLALKVQQGLCPTALPPTLHIAQLSHPLCSVWCNACATEFGEII